jgi:hypothetical protein
MWVSGSQEAFVPVPIIGVGAAWSRGSFSVQSTVSNPTWLFGAVV